MSTIQKLLGTPVSDIRQCPDVNDRDVPVILREVQTIASKCMFCIRSRLSFGFDTFIFLLLEAASAEINVFLQAISEEGSTAAKTLFEIVRQILQPACQSFRNGINIDALFELLQIICSSAQTKESAGKELSSVFLEFMADTRQHHDDYRVHRSCASALISLLRGSKANKDRVSPDCTRITKCLMSSSDFFFQMQCVEILFRLHVYNPTTLANTSMPDALRRGVCSLPNDSTLLIGIQNFLDAFHGEVNRDDMLSFTALRVVLDHETEICGPTTLYFSPTMLIVFIPGEAGDNVTIPFEHIRSVKLSKGSCLSIRLSVISPKILLMMKGAEGQDTLNIFFTQATLMKLRASLLHKWISDRKQATQNIGGCMSENLPVRQCVSPESSRASEPIIMERKMNVPSGNSGHSLSLKATGVNDNSVPVPVRDTSQSDRVAETLMRFRLANDASRKHLEAQWVDDLTQIRRLEASLKEYAAQCVESLNAELEEVQALGVLLNDETDKLRADLSHGVENCRRVEDTHLQKVKSTVDAGMAEMEQFLLEVVESSRNHIWALSQSLDTESTLREPTVVKSRRMEGTLTH